MSGLDWPGAIDDVKACATWLKANGCSKVVVVGFCMGGALSLGSAVQLSEVDACIAFYGWNKQLGDVSTVCIQTPSEILHVFLCPRLFFACPRFVACGRRVMNTFVKDTFTKVT